MTNDDFGNREIQQHSLTRSVVLHLLPGVFILLAVLIVAPLTIKYSLPDMVTVVVGIGLVLIPLELGYLLFRGWKRNGKLSLKGTIRYRDSMSVLKYLLWTVPIMVWILFIFGVVSPPIDDYLIENVFQWLPDWLIADVDTGQHSQSTMLVLWFLALLCNGIFGPLVEELYFRGYLLPRISRYGKWAPFINAVLFSLYHFFSPWQNPARILALLPMVYAVHSKKSIYIGIIVHCGVNTLSMLAMLPDLIGST